jgi:hypothetical protein
MCGIRRTSPETGVPMKKIKTVFVIDRATHRATDVVQVPWVLAGKGVATIKFDGSSSMVENGKLFRRFDAKHGKTPPANFRPAQDAADPTTGHWPGWVPVGDDPSDKFHREAFVEGLEDGTFELVGPKVQSNPHKLAKHELWRHGSVVVEVERTPEGILRWLTENEHEGLVFHHPNGEMAKVRRKDFGIKW